MLNTVAILNRVECCKTCRHYEGGNKRECDGATLFCQNPNSKKYTQVVAKRGKCPNFEPGGKMSLEDDLPKIHELKTWRAPFEEVLGGCKHQVRKYDRDFCVGDFVVLREWDEVDEYYTGRQCSGIISYITRPGQWGLPDDVCVLGLY